MLHICSVQHEIGVAWRLCDLAHGDSIVFLVQGVQQLRLWQIKDSNAVAAHVQVPDASWRTPQQAKLQRQTASPASGSGLKRCDCSLHDCQSRSLLAAWMR